MTDAIPILMYHSISAAATPRFASCALPPSSFQAQMAYLHQQGYTPITVTQLAESLADNPGRPHPLPPSPLRWRGGTSLCVSPLRRNREGPGEGQPGVRGEGPSRSHLPERPVVLTFDDAYADFYTDAFPILRQYGFTATLYVVTAFVNGRARWLRYEGETERPMVTWSQLRELADAGIECGSHTRTHPQVDTLPRAVAWHEIRTSKAELEHELGRPVTTFAYPYGHFDGATRAMVAEVGFTSACAVKIAMSSRQDDRFALARVMPMPEMDLAGYARMLEGRGLRVAPLAPRWQRQVRDRVRRGIVRLERRLGLEALEIEYRTRVHPG